MLHQKPDASLVPLLKGHVQRCVASVCLHIHCCPALQQQSRHAFVPIFTRDGQRRHPVLSHRVHCCPAL
eukprot:7347362-Prymnesium_polylepis.1